MSQRVALAVLVCLALGVAGNAEGSRPRSFRIEGADPFGKGRMNGVALDEEGIVSPGPAAHLLAPDAGAQVWSLIASHDGAIYAGSGSDGAVYRLKGGRAERAAETFEYEVFALSEGKGGRIYASGAPNGTIVEIKPDGTIVTLFDTPEKIVWALLSDDEGNLYAGTGERGYLYRIAPDGKASVLYRAEDSHIVSLAWSKDRKILAGTDGRGLLLEIDPRTGAGRVLYDAACQEVPKIVVGPEGEIYFTAAGTQSSERPSQSGQPEGGKAAEGPSAGEGQRPQPPRLFVREPGGIVRMVWRAPEEEVHGLALDREGRVLVGTGGKAALYRVTPVGDATLLWRPEEGQVLAILMDGAAILAATGNPGRVYRLGPETDGEAWIRPEPLDAGSSASWGRAVWDVLQGGGRWELATRSGDTERPDSSWSGWSPPLSDPEGSVVTSPPARFIQCEARYRPGGSGEPARLRRIWIPYSEPNLPPRVAGIRFSTEEATTSKDGRDSGSYTQDLGGGVRVQIQRTQASAGGGAADEGPPDWVREVRSIAWDAEDPNGDDLLFDVGLRQVGDARFRNLVRDHPTTAVSIDTGTLPDGAYEVEVTATDAPSNAPGNADRTSRIGGPFRVDHEPPVMAELTARHEGTDKLVVVGKARDQASPLRRLEISWDGHPWRPIVPEDGFLDSREESFRVEIPLERDQDGSWIAVRATDAPGNETVRRVWLTD